MNFENLKIGSYITFLEEPVIRYQAISQRTGRPKNISCDGYGYVGSVFQIVAMSSPRFLALKNTNTDRIFSYDLQDGDKITIANKFYMTSLKQGYKKMLEDQKNFVKIQPGIFCGTNLSNLGLING